MRASVASTPPHLDPVQEPGILERVYHGPGRTHLLVGRAEHDARDPRLLDRPGAHRAGLEGAVEDRTEQAPAPEGHRGGAQGEHLGVGGGSARTSRSLWAAPTTSPSCTTRTPPARLRAAAASDASRRAILMKCSSRGKTRVTRRSSRGHRWRIVSSSTWPAARPAPPGRRRRERDRQAAGRRTGRRGPHQPRGRRAGRPQRPRRPRQGRLRLPRRALRRLGGELGRDDLRPGASARTSRLEGLLEDDVALATRCGSDRPSSR